jgi:GntR family transcriptional regulator, transcriptional repressor for pyruvate dehydrogenase complex
MADDIFDQLAAAILQGEMPAGSTLPPERVLAEQFTTSRIIARQAIHRLADLGLVRVRQGGATTVQELDEAGDLRVLEILYRLAPSRRGRVLAPQQVLEKQILQGMCLVEVASRCADPRDLENIRAMTEGFVAGGLDEAGYVRFEELFWRALSKAGDNRIFILEVAWWYRALPERPRLESITRSSLDDRVGFYRELARRLARGDSAGRFYWSVMGPTLEVLRGRSKTGAGTAGKARKTKRRR